MVHSCEAAVANISDIEVVPKLFSKDDEVAYGDSAYSALHNLKKILKDESLSKIDFRMSKKAVPKECMKKDFPVISVFMWNTERPALEVMWSMCFTL